MTAQACVQVRIDCSRALESKRTDIGHAAAATTSAFLALLLPILLSSTLDRGRRILASGSVEQVGNSRARRIEMACSSKS
ncbi:hypothetical protein K505DRAFT_322209 [Melanomma pulvis-pyrius CBS 109.77]|uniref:Uncharacterized protein n=1 Tax=Melanomma pulvis-pyrius CBS 109.77 TaxID=1314802 RepID=A0A6A6XNI3_9PLEO|nr:hypothetical protein K505DRAFT_322209 [Melanomma pulvis-pyrius CBS 109.77]